MTASAGESWAVGLDLGGTNVRAAEVHTDGSVSRIVSRPVDWGADAAPFAQLVDVTREIVEGGAAPPVGIGLGVTGPVDPRTGIIDNPHTLPPTLQGDARGALQRAFDVPVMIENDANVAALAEVRFGAGAPGAVVVCVTVGTGVGVGVVVRGQLHRGTDGVHPEAGHLVVDPAGPLCYCGAHGCIESLASARAVHAAGLTAGVVDAGASARDVHDAAARGVPAAVDVVARAHRALALGVRNLTAVHAADTVVLAGNALGQTARLLDMIRAEVDGFAFRPERGVAVSVSALGSANGCLGAASLVLAP